MEAQRQIRQEAQEKQEILQDLLRWAPETQKRPGAKSAANIRPAGPAVPGKQEGIAPLRTRRTGMAGIQATSSFAPNTLKESTTIPAQVSNGSAAGHTYDNFSRKWDKFDYDSALAETDDENGREKQSFAFPKPSKLSGAPSRTPKAPGMEPRQQNLPVTSEEPTDAELWKDRGNKAFSAKNYAQAKQDYTQSIALQPSCLAYANRAMAELKLEEYSAAEADCTKAIALDAAYVKAYLRRASAAKQLGKLLEAAEDYDHALRLEPTSKATLADAQACFDQLLQQEGLQAHSLRVAIPISHPAAQAPAANTPTNATPAATPSPAQPLSSTHNLTSQVSSKPGQTMQSQQDTPTVVSSSPAAHTDLPQHSNPSPCRQVPDTGSMSSATKPAEPSQQSKHSSTGAEPTSLRRPGSQSEGQPSSSHVPHPGIHTRSHFGMAPQRRRAQPSVVIEEVLSDEEDLTQSQGSTTLLSSSTPSAAAPPTSQKADAASLASTQRDVTDRPAGVDTAAMASHTPSEPTLQSGQDMTEADACQGLSSGSGLRQAVDDLTGPNDASGVQLPSSAASAVAGGQSATEQPGGHLPNGRTDKPAQIQQAEFNDLQAASMPAAPPAALLQPSPAATQPGYSAPASQAGVPRNGQGPASLSGARTNGVAVSSAAAQMAGVSTEPHLAAATAASRDHQLQAAALEGTATKSQAAISAGLSLVTPRSGSEFEVSWKRLKGNAAGKEGFLRQLDPLQLPALFKQSLTAPVLQGIAMSALNMIMAQNDHFGIQLLENLKSVPRFDMIVMSLPRREKAALKEHFDAAQSAPVVDSVLARRLECVRHSYRV